MEKAENFGDECRLKFVSYCQARAKAPFHKTKREYERLAWEQVDAFLDWRDIQEM